MQESLSRLSHLQNLEYAVILDRSGYHPRLSYADVVSISRVLRCLRQLSIISFEDFDRDESHEKTVDIWIRTPASASEAMRMVDSQPEWRLTHMKVFDVVEGLWTLLRLHDT